MQLHTSTQWKVIDRSSTGTTVYAYAYFVFGLFDSLRPSQHSFSYIGKGLGLNQYKAKINVSCSMT